MGGRLSSLLAHALQLWRRLQPLVVVGADGEHGDDGRAVGHQQVTHQRQERLRLALGLRQEQLLALVDGE